MMKLCFKSLHFLDLITLIERTKKFLVMLMEKLDAPVL